MADAWPKFYILLDKTPMAVDMETWGRWFEKNDRFVAQTMVGKKVRVSTVFLGLDHCHSRFLPGHENDPPLIFETMVFGGPMAGWMDRYSTWAEAERGHTEIVAEVRKAVAQIDAMKKGAKADG